MGRSFRNGFSGPKCFQGFREMGHWIGAVMGALVQAHTLKAINVAFSTLFQEVFFSFSVEFSSHQKLTFLFNLVWIVMSLILASMLNNHEIYITWFSLFWGSLSCSLCLLGNLQGFLGLMYAHLMYSDYRWFSCYVIAAMLVDENKR